MASKTVLMAALFDQFTSFIGELQEMYPEDTDFPMFLTTVRLMKSANPSMLAKYIFTSTHPFEDKIMSKDEKFFLDNEFSEYSENVDMNVFDKLKKYVASMSDSSKDCVWKYCQNITRLSKACQT
jgi:hypothetical protein